MFASLYNMKKQNDSRLVKIICFFIETTLDIKSDSILFMSVSITDAMIPPEMTMPDSSNRHENYDSQMFNCVKIASRFVMVADTSGFTGYFNKPIKPCQGVRHKETHE